MPPSKTAAAARIKPLKRSDLIAQEIKRLITEKNLSPGDRLPRESELQAQFQVSKGTIREALKSLEVQGLVTISTGPSGGGTIVQVPLDRTLQFMQNYLFFQEVTIEDIYGVRQMLEPELAAGAVPYLTEQHFHALEHSITCCDPTQSDADLVQQRHEDVNFHDILAKANPNPFLRFTCELINEMIRQLIVFGNRTPKSEHRRFGQENATFHRDIVEAARARDADKVRQLMHTHMASARHSVTRMKGRLQGRLILDADAHPRVHIPLAEAAGVTAARTRTTTPKTAPKTTKKTTRQTANKAASPAAPASRTAAAARRTTQAAAAPAKQRTPVAAPLPAAHAATAPDKKPAARQRATRATTAAATAGKARARKGTTT